MTDALPPLPEAVEKAIVELEMIAGVTADDLNAIRLAIRRALMEEREANAITCEKIAEDRRDFNSYDAGYIDGASGCASMIRTRPTEPTP